MCSRATPLCSEYVQNLARAAPTPTSRIGDARARQALLRPSLVLSHNIVRSPSWTCLIGFQGRVRPWAIINCRTQPAFLPFQSSSRTSCTSGSWQPSVRAARQVRGRGRTVRPGGGAGGVTHFLSLSSNRTPGSGEHHSIRAPRRAHRALQSKVRPARALAQQADARERFWAPGRGRCARCGVSATAVQSASVPPAQGGRTPIRGCGPMALRRA